MPKSDVHVQIDAALHPKHICAAVFGALESSDHRPLGEEFVDRSLTIDWDRASVLELASEYVHIVTVNARCISEKKQKGTDRVRALPYEVVLDNSRVTWRIEPGRLLKNGTLHVDLTQVDQVTIKHRVRETGVVEFRLQFEFGRFKEEISHRVNANLLGFGLKQRFQESSYHEFERRLLGELARVRPNALVRDRRSVLRGLRELRSGGPAQLDEWWLAHRGTSSRWFRW